MLEKIKCTECSFELLHDGSASGLSLKCPECGHDITLPGELPSGCVVKTENYSYELYGQHPVQADGEVFGHPLYFRAKWNFWYFTVCTSHDFPDAASSIAPLDNNKGFFVNGDYTGYWIGEDYGKNTDAGSMSVDTAKAIIEECINHFIHDYKTS